MPHICWWQADPRGRYHGLSWSLSPALILWPFQKITFYCNILLCVKWLCFSGKLVRRKWRLPASFSWFWLSPSISRWRQARSEYKHFDGERKSDLCSACLRLAECVNSLLSWHFSPTSIEAWIPMIIKIFQVFIEFFNFLPIIFLFQFFSLQQNQLFSKS